MGIGNFIKEQFTRVLYKEVLQVGGYFHRQVWTNRVAADADRILNDAVDNTVHTTFLAQPDFARLLSLVLSGAGTEEVIVAGTNIRGEAISETVTMNGATPVATTKAFKTVTSITFPNTAGSRTLDVGVLDALGLDRCMSGNEVILATADGVYETTRPTVTFDSNEVEKNTVDLNTALDAAVDVVVDFIATEININATATSA